MIRVLPDDVVKAYMHTGLIPIRCAWNSDDGRGGCAFVALARHRGIDTDDLLAQLADRYEEGFILAWDADDPRHTGLIAKIKADRSNGMKRGFCDGLLCRTAVENTFSTAAIISISNES